MLKKRNKIFIKILLYIPYIWLFYVLQSMIFPHLPLFGVKPLLLPVLVVGAALFEGYTYGGIIGLFCGILCDLSFNQPTIQFTLILTGIGIIVGILSDNVLARGFPSYILSCLGSLLLCGIFQSFGFFVSGVHFFSVINTILCQTIYSILLALPMYYSARFVGRTPKG